MTKHLFDISMLSERSNLYMPSAIDGNGEAEYIFPVRERNGKTLIYAIEEWNSGVIRLSVRVWDGEQMIEPARYEDAVRMVNGAMVQGASATEGGAV